MRLNTNEHIYLSLDLEMNQPSGQIIQIGACIGNIQTGEVLETFSQLVCIDEPLNPFIITLCRVTDEELRSKGIPLIEAYQKLIKLHEKYQCQTNPITWGGGDSQVLRVQLTQAYDKIIIGKTFGWPFGRRWLDIKTLHQFVMLARGTKVQAGLAKAMTRYKLAFKGAKHNAMDDAINTFLLAHHIVKNYIKKESLEAKP